MKKVAALLVLALVSAALVACGDDDEGTTANTTGGEISGTTVEENPSIIYIEADPGGGLAYTEDNLTAKAGATRIEFENPQPIGHDADLEDENGKVVGNTEVVSESGDAGTMDPLKPGKYVFFCSVPGHREAGMEATLTVE